MEIHELVGNLGFPVAVTFYLLIRVESKLELLTESIRALNRSLVKYSGNTVAEESEESSKKAA